MEIENLKALVCGRVLTAHQRALAIQEFGKLVDAKNELLDFAKEMVHRYPNSPWIYEQGNAAIKKATE